MSNFKAFTMLDDFSPFIVYEKTWQDQSAIHKDQSVPGLDPYFNRTHHTSTADRACFKISFVGTRIDIFGTLRLNHGAYSVVIDSDPGSTPGEIKDGYSKEEKTNSTLFSAEVALGTHRVWVFNEPGITKIADRNTLGLDAISMTGYPVAWTDIASPQDPVQAVGSTLAQSSSSSPIFSSLSSETDSPSFSSSLSSISTSTFSPPPIQALPPPANGLGMPKSSLSLNLSSIATASAAFATPPNQRQQAQEGPNTARVPLPSLSQSIGHRTANLGHHVWFCTIMLLLVLNLFRF